MRRAPFFFVIACAPETPSPGLDGFARVPGAYVALEDGAPVMRVEASGKRLGR